eukprot:jgi/Undpi1/12846/HiC_scaffold_7.g02513.m1
MAEKRCSEARVTSLTTKWVEVAKAVRSPTSSRFCSRGGLGRLRVLTTLHQNTRRQPTIQRVIMAGASAGNGGHIYTSGLVYVDDACELIYGSATGNGGAVYVDVEGSFNPAGGATYTSNAADGDCDDVYVSGGHPVCQPSSVAGLGKTVESR